MKIIRNFLDKQEKHFLKGGKLEGLYYFFEVIECFFFMRDRTKSGAHIRDGIDLKRMMTTVMLALVPTVLMAFYNTGLQANLVIAQAGMPEMLSWQQKLLTSLGVGFDPANIFGNFVHGAFYFLPVYIITFAVGIFWELVFANVRKHPVNEGFFVTSLLFPLILPPMIPYWQVALGISFGVVIGKEVFGGVGMNILNPALVGRAFLFFAYPAQISGDKVWAAVDSVSMASPLAQFADSALETTATWWDAFLGFIPGSMGETSALACLIGAVILIVTGIGSWRIMISIFVSMFVFSTILNLIGSTTNPMFAVTPLWHMVLGGFAFGAVYMATDPVTGTMTMKGKYFYGALIGFLVVMVRVLNPAFPEGMMLAILFANVFAPIIDRVFINANIKRRLARHVQ